MSNESKTDKRNKKNKLRIMIILLFIVIVVLILLLLRQCKAEEEIRRIRDPNAAVGQLEGKTMEEIQAELDRVVEQGMFNISINTGIVFPDGKSPGDMKIENVPSNHYLMSVQITLDDTGEVVYTSGLLEPNQHIASAPLDVELAQGRYSATATFTAHDIETEISIGQAAAKVTLIVQN